jgi:hypothetical protein
VYFGDLLRGFSSEDVANVPEKVVPMDFFLRYQASPILSSSLAHNYPELRNTGNLLISNCLNVL